LSSGTPDHYSLLVATRGPNYNHGMLKLESILECVFDEDIVTDGVMAQNLAQIEDF